MVPPAFGSGVLKLEMKDLLYYSHVDQDTGKIRVPKRFEAEIAEKFRGKDIEIVVRRKRKQRSSEQNRYYWGVVIPYILEAFAEIGNDLQQGNPEHAQIVHSFLKGQFLPPRLVCDADGVELKMEPSTTALSKMEFVEYLDRVIQFAAERLQIVIPEPEEQLKLFEQ